MQWPKRNNDEILAPIKIYEIVYAIKEYIFEIKSMSIQHVHQLLSPFNPTNMDHIPKKYQTILIMNMVKLYQFHLVLYY